MNTQRTAFFISDGTGITAERLGHSLITQFDHISFKTQTLPYVNTIDKAKAVVSKIEKTSHEENMAPIVFATIVDNEIREIISRSSGFYLDFFHTFVDRLESELNTKAQSAVGRSHAVRSNEEYTTRIDSVNFALQYDDGVSTRGFPLADIILVGVSRCGKTPTCLYLALQFGIRAANYPITEEDLNVLDLPNSLRNFHSKIVGLSIEPERLQGIRQKRRPNSRYSDLEQCQHEVKMVEALFKKAQIPFLHSTHLSIEELSTQILAMTGISRRLR